jgi:hypothetical protein
MFFHIISSISTFERELISERIRCGLERCKQNGVKLGRPSSVNESLRISVRLLKEKGLGVREICRKLSLGTNTFYKIIREVE